jgi:hypothetical protein
LEFVDVIDGDGALAAHYVDGAGARDAAATLARCGAALERDVMSI